MKVAPRCDACHETGLAKFKEEEEQAARATRLRTWREEDGRDAFTDTDPVQLPNPAAYKKVMLWEYGQPVSCFTQPSGHGKSRLLWALAERLYVEERCRNVVVIGATAFARAVMRRRAGGRG